MSSSARGRPGVCSPIGLSADGKNSCWLLEAGPKDSKSLDPRAARICQLFKDKSVNWMYQTEPEPGLGGRQVSQPRGKVLAGSSSIKPGALRSRTAPRIRSLAPARQCRLGL